jgi:pimeloyl-ACP methyl ester carboxylesterase
MNGIRPLFTAAAALLLLGGVLAIRASVETKLIFPGASSQGRPDTLVRPGSDYELIPLHIRDGTRIVAQFGRALDPRGRPDPDSIHRLTVIFFYGNGACVASMGDVFSRFRRLGANVLMPEFPGYGMSDGRPSERGFYAAGDAAYDYLLTRRDVDPGRIVLAGWSMGAAVAVDLAARRRALALITISAFTTLPSAAHALVPWLPTSLIIRSRFDNLAKIAGVSCPIMIAHGSRDSLVPPSMAGELAAAAKGDATTIQVTGAGHNDVFDVGGDPLWSAFAEFLGRQAPGR